MLTFATFAFAADVPIRHRGDALYLERTRRDEAAADWFLAHLDDHLSDYVRVIGQVPDHRTPALVAQIEQWRAAHPDDGEAAVALAMAHSYAGLGRGAWTVPFHSAGPWCEPALEVLSVLPADGVARFRVLRARVKAARACGAPTDEDEAALEALALSGDAGAYYRAWYGARDEVDADDVAALEAALEARPYLIAELGLYFSDERAGPALDDARSLLLERARGWATAEHPADVAAAIAILAAAKLDDEVRAAREHLAALDPDNRQNTWALQPKREAPKDDDAPPDPTTILDPAQRLAALKATAPPSERWRRAEHFGAIADAAGAVGDVEAELDALARLMTVAWGSSTHVRYARATADAGRDLKRGARAADRAVEFLRDPWGYQPPSEHEPVGRWRDALADALDARALVAVARGRDGRAIDDLEEALLLTDPTPDRLVRLGVLYDARGGGERAAPLLARALAELPADDPRVPDATERLSRWLASQKGWQPDVATFVAASRAPERAVDEARPALDASLFTDLVVQIDGAEQRLLDLEGPIVLDVWATWCGPCTASLPHLDTLARRYEGQVTFVAASVDEELATAERYLEKRGDAAFTAAFLGADGMKRIGVSGIPAMFVFDAEHQLVARLSGWGPGNTELDEALEAMLGDTGGR